MGVNPGSGRVRSNPSRIGDLDRDETAGLLVKAARGVEQLGRLPSWLANAVSGDRVVQALLRQVPEFSSGGLMIRTCQPRHFRLQGDRWYGKYRVTVEAPGGDIHIVELSATLHPPGVPEPAARMATPFGSPDWRCELPELGLDLQMPLPDRSLPAMGPLTVPEEARRLLQGSIPAQTKEFAALRIESCVCRLLRYHPGNRCTILIDLVCGPEADPAWPRAVVAKVYLTDKGRNAFAGMHALWRSPAATGRVVRLAQPLAYIDEKKILLQEALPEGLTLADLEDSSLRSGAKSDLARLQDRLERTAEGLVALHTSGISYGRVVRLEDKLAELRHRVANLAVALPALADAASPILQWVERLDRRHPADPVAPSHRSFHPGQVVLNGDSIGFIDFDGLCMAEPALDLGQFSATMKTIGMQALVASHGSSNWTDQATGWLAQLDELWQRFLARYEAIAKVSQDRILLWEALALLTHVIHSWVKIKPDRLERGRFLLEQHLLSLADPAFLG
jgi:thiamine kinase-like enzyme